MKTRKPRRLNRKGLGKVVEDILEANPAPQHYINARLVHMETPHGEFLRYAYVTTTADGGLVSVDNFATVFNTPEEATNAAHAMVSATSMPVLHIKRTFQSVH